MQRRPKLRAAHSTLCLQRTRVSLQKLWYNSKLDLVWKLAGARSLLAFGLSSEDQKLRMSKSKNQVFMPASKQRGVAALVSPSPIRLSGYIVITSSAAVLSLVTAAECQSVIHPASLVYALVLWGW
jgi:hypothetical protein